MASTNGVQTIGTLLVACLGLAGCAPTPDAPVGENADEWTDVRVEAVASQALLAQIDRVKNALELLGQPLPASVLLDIETAREEWNDRDVTAAVQNALDPLCLLTIVIEGEDRFQVHRGAGPATLVEQGWTSFLIKIVNRAEIEARLEVDSPHAGSIPGSAPGIAATRWMDVELFDRQPLRRALSGFPLEYRAIQIYARDAGVHRARLDFGLTPLASARPARDGSGRLIRAWDFDADDTSGWRPLNACRLESRAGALRAIATGADPYFAVSQSAPGGDMVLRFAARTAKVVEGQVFWWTRERPQPDGGRLRSFRLGAAPGVWQRGEVRFRAASDLAGVRIDPGNGPGEVEFDWIELAYERDHAAASESIALAFNVDRSTRVSFAVSDDRGRPTTAAFVIRDEQGRVYPARGKRLAPDFFFQSQVYRADRETVRLPSGTYSVECSRGPESIPTTKSLVVGRTPTELTYRVERWVDPAERGWWSGDHHIHAAGCRHYSNPTEGVRPRDMARHIQGEDLKVGSNLTWGPCFDYQKQFFTAREDDASSYPYILRYDIEVSGFGSHRSGHLCLLRLKEQIYPGGESKDHWPTLGLNTLRWAKQQGAICGPAHSASGLHGSVGRANAPDGPDGLPSFAIPNYDGIGANEFIVDVTHRVPGPGGELVPAVDFISTMDTDRRAELTMWYHVLNCGFRVRASGETDFPCISGDRVGMGRVYAKVDGRLTYDAWCEALARGRSYVSDGTAHLMELTAQSVSTGATVELGVAESELRLDAPGVVRLRAIAAVRHPAEARARIEVVVNGFPVEEKEIPATGIATDVSFDVRVEKSSWVALRVFPSAHTNPIFVLVQEKPIRALKASAEWCRRGVDQCWSQKARTYAEAEQEDAIAAYEHARRVYDRIWAECEE